MEELWPALTADTIVLERYARQLLGTGAPLPELHRQVVESTAAGTTPQFTELQLEPGLAQGWLFGMLHELALEQEQRRHQGAFYTPRGIALYMVQRAISELRPAVLPDAVGTARRRPKPLLQALDLAAGSGAFLLSILEVWQAHLAAKPQLALTGIDLDAVALANARRALQAAGNGKGFKCELLVRDSLLTDPPCHGAGFDLVVSNPPYLDSERLTRQQPGLREALRTQFRSARGNWDASCVFVERAVQLVRPGGVVAMLVPRKLLAADYAAALHAILLEHELLELCDLAGLPVFKAGVQAAVLIVRRRRAGEAMAQPLDASTARSGKLWPPSSMQEEAPGTTTQLPLVLCRTARAGQAADRFVGSDLLSKFPPGYWSAAFDPAVSEISRVLAMYPPLGQFAEVCDGCSTEEAYRMAGHLRDSADGEDLQFINTGVIRPYAVLWGLRETVYLKQKYRHPCLEPVRFQAGFPRRWCQARTAKLLIPGLAGELRAVADVEGQMACGKGAVQLLPKPLSAATGSSLACSPGSASGSGLPLMAWLAWLNSSAAGWLYRVVFGGRGFGERSLHIGPRQLSQLPVPIEYLLLYSSELAGLADALSRSQRVWWSEAGEAALARGRQARRVLPLVDAWRQSAPARRIDEIVNLAYGWVEPGSPAR